MKYPTVAFKLYPLMVTGMMPLCPDSIFEEDFTTAMLCCCSQFLVEVKNDPSLSIMLYTLVWADERPAPESIRTSNLFPVSTVTVGQSDTSCMV